MGSIIGLVLDIPRKAALAQVGETVVSRCFVGSLGQARKRCSNRCCCGLRNYASDLRPTDPHAAGGGVESPSQILALPELCSILLLQGMMIDLNRTVMPRRACNFSL